MAFASNSSSAINVKFYIFNPKFLSIKPKKKRLNEL